MDALTSERYPLDAAPERPEGTVPACPVCGHQTTGMTRYKRLRPHSERRVGKTGKPYDSRMPCAGIGEFPEWVTPMGGA